MDHNHLYANMNFYNQAQSNQNYTQSNNQNTSQANAQIANALASQIVAQQNRQSGQTQPNQQPAQHTQSQQITFQQSSGQGQQQPASTQQYSQEQLRQMQMLLQQQQQQQSQAQQQARPQVSVAQSQQQTYHTLSAASHTQQQTHAAQNSNTHYNLQAQAQAQQAQAQQQVVQQHQSNSPNQYSQYTQSQDGSFRQQQVQQVHAQQYGQAEVQVHTSQSQAQGQQQAQAQAQAQAQLSNNEVLRQHMKNNLYKYTQQHQQQAQAQNGQGQSEQTQQVVVQTTAHQQQQLQQVQGQSQEMVQEINGHHLQQAPTSYEQQLQGAGVKVKGQVGRPKGSTNKNKIANQSLLNTGMKKKGSGRPPKVLDAKKRKKKENHVKRPMTAYLYFVSKYRQNLKDEGQPIPKAKEMTQECARQWRVMTPPEKLPYETLAKTDRDRWEREKAAAEKPRDPLRPKRPPSAYFLFLNDFRRNYTAKSDPAKEITKKAGAAWNAMTEEDKKPYQAVAQTKRLEWETALKAYKIKVGEMTADGIPTNFKANQAQAIAQAAANAAALASQAGQGTSTSSPPEPSLSSDHPSSSLAQLTMVNVNGSSEAVQLQLLQTANIAELQTLQAHGEAPASSPEMTDEQQMELTNGEIEHQAMEETHEPDLQELGSSGNEVKSESTERGD